MGGRRAKYKQPPPAPLREADVTRLSTKKLGKRKANLDHESEQTTNGRPTKKAKGDTSRKPLPREKAAKTVSKPTPAKPLSEDGESDGWENASDLEDVDAANDLDEFDLDEE